MHYSFLTVYSFTFFVLFVILSILIWIDEEPPDSIKSVMVITLAIICATAILAIPVTAIILMFAGIHITSIMRVCMYIIACFGIGYVCSYILPRISSRRNKSI